jgi:hypothetical protein
MTHDLDTAPRGSRLRTLCAPALRAAARALRSLATAAEKASAGPGGATQAPDVPPTGGDNEGQDGRYHFTYPAHAAFSVSCAGGPEAAQALASAVVGRLMESEAPLVAVPGALRGEPRIRDVEVWLGSVRGDGDALELEATD